MEFYNSAKSEEEKEGLASIECNIWACIYRAYQRTQFEESNDNRPPSFSENVFQPKMTFGIPSSSFTEMTDSTFTSDLIMDMEVWGVASQFQDGKLYLLFLYNL